MKDGASFWMFSISISISTSAMLAIAGLTLFGIVNKHRSFWPPPNAEGWQHTAFRVLFRSYFYGLLTVSALDFEPTKNRLYAGLPLLIIGFGCALFWTNYLGWRNAFGKPDGLRTSGVYRFSRNPIYLASIIGMVGWAIVVPSWKVTVLLSLWAALYIVAPWVEEPWMTRKYGKAFVQYKESTPRFL